jgi:hypothetical protein
VGGGLRGPAPLAEDLKAGNRYDAACAAARAGCGQGAEATPLSDTEKARWRRQALDWLRADLALWEKQLGGDLPPGRAEALKALRHWRQDPDLAGVRDESALAQLPEAERPAWRKLWAEVEALLAKAGS